MFLLILTSSAAGLLGKIFFTFQYVSINTTEEEVLTGAAIVFTFQYVSINTFLPVLVSLLQSSLHSNMFLLIRFFEK